VDHEGFEFWEHFAVCFVFDGRHKASSSSLQFLSELGIYNSDVLLDGKQCPEVQLHLLEFTAQIPATLFDECMQAKRQTVVPNAGGGRGQEEEEEEKDAEEGCEHYFPPLQTLFALKEHNGGKLNSHLWAFNALCSQIKPDYVVLLDVGTEPLNNAIGLLYHRLEENRDVVSRL
jgi:chitin synthase